MIFCCLQPEPSLKDVSIQDFANSSRITTTQRLPKSQLSQPSRVKAPSSNLLEAPVDFEESEDEDDPAAEDCEDITMNLGVGDLKVPQAGEPVRHPPEVWHLVGNYILPEDVSRFGAVCRDTYAVVNSASFWLQLYKDFYYIDRHTERIEGNQV